MRPIKFRAYDRIDERIYYDVIPFGEFVVLKYSQAGYEMLDIEIEDYDLIYSEDFSDYEIMQYTGLKDKNGLEIFEGDIVHIKQDRVEDKYIPHNTNCEISYEDGAFTVKSKVNETEWPINAGLYYVTWKEFEVIGNVYENPELLEVVDK